MTCSKDNIISCLDSGQGCHPVIKIEVGEGCKCPFPSLTSRTH